MKIIKKQLRKLINEESKRLSYTSKEQGFTYGIEHLPDQYDQKKADDIIGHTWLTHVRKKGSSLNEVGYVLWHSLNESGHIALYDVEWPDGRVETNIPARQLIEVRNSEHPLSEGHGTKEGKGHGVDGHKENSSLDERKYKKRKSKKKKKVDYKKAYKKYHSSKKAKTERAMRNAAGRIMKKLGKKKAGYEVDHIIPISKGGTNDQDNLRMIPKSINRKLGQGITTSIRREKDVYEGKKKKLSKKQLKIAQAAPPPDEITGADFAALRAKKDKKIDEFVSQIDERKRKRKIRKYATPGEKSYRAKNYGGGKKRLKDFERAAHEYRKGNVKKAAAIRQRMEKKHMAESSKLDRNTLKEMIEEILQFEMLENFMIEMDVLEDVDELMLNERKKRRKRRKSKKKAKSKGGGLSAAVKKSLDKKADRRCLTRGSVYSEFRKGLAAFLSSGSRKGMSAHQWAHARVNSANPSKSWASVKKRKKCPKKKKK